MLVLQNKGVAILAIPLLNCEIINYLGEEGMSQSCVGTEKVKTSS